MSESRKTIVKYLENAVNSLSEDQGYEADFISENINYLQNALDLFKDEKKLIKLSQENGAMNDVFKNTTQNQHFAATAMLEAIENEDAEELFGLMCAWIENGESEELNIHERIMVRNFIVHLEKLI